MAPRPTASTRPRQSKPQSKRRQWLVLLPWLVTLAILGVSAAIVFVPREAKLRDPSVPGQTGALVWGDGVFSNALELQAWLRVRGVSYRSWARKHPAAVELLAPEPSSEAAPAITRPKPKPAAKTPPKPAAKATPKPAAKATPKPAAKATPKPAAPKATPATTEVKGTETTAATDPSAVAGPSWADRLRDHMFLVVLAILVPLAAVVAVTISRRLETTPGSGIGFRLGFAASAASVAIGFVVASLFS